ncbi:MAG: CsgG/HfaB family protein [Fibrobacterota bacterium]
MRYPFYMVLLVLTCLFAVSSPALAEEKPIRSIAVLDMEGTGLDAGEVKTLSEALRNNVIELNAYTVLERSKMDVILKEQGFQQSGACTNDACAVEMGQLLGVDAMIVGSIGKVGKTYSISVRMLDLGTSRILRSASQYYKGEIDGLLTETIVGIAKKICVRDKPALSEAAQDAVKTTPAASAETTPAPASDESVQKGKSNTWLYVTLGVAALAGGIGAFILMNNASNDKKTPTATDERPAYPNPPASLVPQMKGGR